MPDQDDSILRELEALQGALEAGEILNSTPVESLLITDLYSDFEHLFNDQAKEQAQNKMKIQHRNVKNEEGLIEFQQTKYFSLRAIGVENIKVAAALLIEEINLYAKAGFISGFLCNISSMPLVATFGSPPSYCVFIFPMLTAKGLEFLKEHPSPTETLEGGQPSQEIS